MKPQGFTLAELLIALTILGVIAIFTIPKVLQSQQDTRYSAAAKEVATQGSQAALGDAGVVRGVTAEEAAEALRRCFARCGLSHLEAEFGGAGTVTEMGCGTVWTWSRCCAATRSATVST